MPAATFNAFRDHGKVYASLLTIWIRLRKR